MTATVAKPIPRTIPPPSRCSSPHHIYTSCPSTAMAHLISQQHPKPPERETPTWTKVLNIPYFLFFLWTLSPLLSYHIPIPILLLSFNYTTLVFAPRSSVLLCEGTHRNAHSTFLFFQRGAPVAVLPLVSATSDSLVFPR